GHYDTGVSNAVWIRRVSFSIALVSLASVLSCASGSRPDDATLIQRLDDPRWQIRASSAEELGRRGVASASTKLGAVLSDKSEEVRGSALIALDRLGARSELDKIRKIIDDEDDPQVTVLALFALADLAEGERGDAQSKDAERIFTKVFDDNRRVKRAA